MNYDSPNLERINQLKGQRISRKTRNIVAIVMTFVAAIVIWDLAAAVSLAGLSVAGFAYWHRTYSHKSPSFLEKQELEMREAVHSVSVDNNVKIVVDYSDKRLLHTPGQTAETEAAIDGIGFRYNFRVNELPEVTSHKPQISYTEPTIFTEVAEEPDFGGGPTGEPNDDNLPPRPKPNAGGSCEVRIAGAPINISVDGLAPYSQRNFAR